MPEAVNAPRVPAGEQGASFRERTMQRLQSESGSEEQQEQHPLRGQGPAQGHPSPDDGSAEDVTQDEGFLDDEDEGYAEYDGDDDDLDAAALDDEAPGDDPEADLGDDEDDSPFKKRYEDLRAEFNRYLEQHQGFEREHAESMSQHLELRFELEDKLQEAVDRAGFLYNTMSGNAQRFRNINWSQVPPDKVQEVQAQAQAALQMEQQAAQAFQQVQQQSEETRRLVKQREAAIAKTRLRRTIPGWSNETYAELREFAVNSGMAPQAFNELTNPVIIEWAYAAKQLADAGRKGSQKRTTKRKAKVPTSRQAVQRQPRNDRGQFARKQTVPNQRGSFADKHQHRLRMERRGGR